MEELKLKTTNPLKHFTETPQTSGKYSLEERQEIAKASKGFESLLTGMMLKSMTSTTEGLFGEDSYGGDFFDTIFNAEMSSQISESQGLGIAEQIYRKITGEELDLNALNQKSAKAVSEIGDINNTEVSSTGSTEKQKEVTVSDTDGFREIKPSNRTLDRVERFDNLIDKAAEEFNIDRNIIKSIIMAESAGNEKAVSKANAKGLMQLMDGTATDMGVKNSFDPKQNIYGGAKYFSGLLRQYNGDLELSLAAYNAGPGNVQKYNGVPPFEETNTYIQRVIGYYNYFNG